MSNNLLSGMTRDAMPKFVQHLIDMHTGHQPMIEGLKGLASDAFKCAMSLQGLVSDCSEMVEMMPLQKQNLEAQRNKIIEGKCAGFYAKYNKHMALFSKENAK